MAASLPEMRRRLSSANRCGRGGSFAPVKEEKTEEISPSAFEVVSFSGVAVGEVCIERLPVADLREGDLDKVEITVQSGDEKKLCEKRLAACSCCCEKTFLTVEAEVKCRRIFVAILTG